MAGDQVVQEIGSDDACCQAFPIKVVDVGGIAHLATGTEGRDEEIVGYATLTCGVRRASLTARWTCLTRIIDIIGVIAFRTR